MPRGTRDTSQILADTDVARTEILQAEARLSRLYCVHCGTEDSLDQVPLVNFGNMLKYSMSIVHSEHRNIADMGLDGTLHVGYFWKTSVVKVNLYFLAKQPSFTFFIKVE